jgi:HK97 family phage portal protein
VALSCCKGGEKLKISLLGRKFDINLGRIIQSLPKPYDEDAWHAYLVGKGYAVNHSTALRVAVVIRCADVVAKTMASLGCHLYKEIGDGKERAKAHPLYKMLRMMPNQETTAYEFWHMYVFNLMLTKGAYAKIVRDQNGFIRELWNIPTNHVFPDRNSVTGERYIDVVYSSRSYQGVKNVTGERIYAPNFMYTPGLRFQDEDDPHDFIKIAADVLGLSMALSGYAKDFFENGANLGGFVEYPNAINEEAFNRFRADWEKTYAGVVNQHKWALLEGGFKLTKFDSDPEKAQALESRKFEIIEVCRIMGVPPHKVFELDRATFNNIEQINIEYVQETIDPMAERLEQTIYKDLLTSNEQKKHYAKFNANKLLKGDTQARTNYYNTMRQNGVLNADEIRDLEDMNKLPEGKGGDAYLVNGNMISLANAVNNLPKSMQKGVAN